MADGAVAVAAPEDACGQIDPGQLAREVEEDVYEEIHQQRNEQIRREWRIVVVGLTGSGKSNLCNNITMKEHHPLLFASIGGPESITKQCKQEAFTCTTAMGNRPVSIVDTPGFFDTDTNQTDNIREIVKCVFLTSPGPHAFLFPIRADLRCTEEILKGVNDCLKLFESGSRRHVIFVLTGKDRLAEMGITQRSINVYKDKLQAITGKREFRFILWNNAVHPESEENKTQVAELFDMIGKMIHFNEDTYYTNEVLTKAEKIIRDRERAAAKAAARNVQENIRKVTEEYKGKIKQAEGDAKRQLMKALTKEIKGIVAEAKESSRNPTLDVRDEIKRQKGGLMAWVHHKLVRWGLTMSLKGMAGLMEAMNGIAEGEFPIPEMGDQDIDGPVLVEEPMGDQNIHGPVLVEEPVASADFVGI